MDVTALRQAAENKDKVALLAGLYGPSASEYRSKKGGEEFLADLEEAEKVDDSELRSELTALFKRVCPSLESLNAAASDPQPRPLIRPSNGRGSLLSAGEIMLLAGAGGAGKSTLACQIALTAAHIEASGRASNGSEWADVAGLSVRIGRVVILSYEDRRWRVWKRCQLICKTAGLDDMELESALDHIGIVQADGWPLFGIPDGGHIGQAPERLDVWEHLWPKIAQWQPSIVIIDPALCAYNGEDSRVAAVRAFLDAIRNEAAQIDAGVIVIAHTTKAARKSSDGALDPGAVSGSAAWTDAARTALLLQCKSDDKSAWELSTIKANYSGPLTLNLQSIDGQDGELAGFELVDYSSNGNNNPHE